VKYGKQPNGEQRYQCQHPECDRTIFLLNYENRGNQPATRSKIIEMAGNGSGIRETARVLKISPVTVISVALMGFPWKPQEVVFYPMPNQR
jgi:transposase-like protein